MLSIIITTFKETKTLSQTLRVILAEKLDQPKEILIVAPDSETQDLIRDKFSNFDEVKFIKDSGHGKPAALNLAFKHTKGDILILTDGDVVIREDSLVKLISQFENQKVGAICGQPISISPKNTVLGYWSHFLTDAAHNLRTVKNNVNQYIDCSGYLYAIRAGVVNQIPENTLSDDIYISTKISQSDYRIKYEPDAKVEVKYPTNFRDWIIQKRRSAAGHSQKFDCLPGGQKAENINSSMRSFSREVLFGIKLFFSYPENIREFVWLWMLFVARIYLWILIFIDKKILRKKYTPGWKRVESSK